MSTERWSVDEGKRIEAPKVDAFLADVAEVCRRHGMSISHEDGHGSFIVTDFDEGNLDWLGGASVKLGPPAES